MKIYGINNSVQFGYNKELNDTVNKKLEKSKKNKEVAQSLLNLNRLCNDAEDNLIQAEKENNTRKADIYENLFLSLKPLVTDELNKRFPLLKYKDIELEGYKEDMKTRNIKQEDFHWLGDIVDILENFENWDIPIVGQVVDLTNNAGGVGNTQKADGGGLSATEEKSKEAKCPKCLEKFTPTEISPKGFVSIGGMESIKELLQDKILYPLKNPEEAKLDEIEYGKKYPRGTMFYGPPGCGKTSTIEALVAESGLPMYKLKVSKAGSKYINESSGNIQKAYEYLYHEAQNTGAPVFFVLDEMESLAPSRDGEHSEDNKMVGTLLQIIEEARGKGVVVLGATNNFDMIDEAIRSRFDDKIYIGLPDKQTRKEVLKIHLSSRTKGLALAKDDAALDKVAELTNGFSNRDIAILTDKAALIARKEGRRDICADDYIVPVRENQNMKIKEKNYQDKQSRKTIGY